MKQAIKAKNDTDTKQWCRNYSTCTGQHYTCDWNRREQIQSSDLRSVPGFTFKSSLRERLKERDWKRERESAESIIILNDFNNADCVRSRHEHKLHWWLSQKDESAWISEGFTALHSISYYGVLRWSLNRQIDENEYVGGVEVDLVIWRLTSTL